jgi:hypothetical protein
MDQSPPPSRPEPAGTAAPWWPWAGAWGGAVAIAFANAAARQGCARALGARRAEQVSGVSLLVLLAPWVRRTEQRHPLATTRDAVGVGALWVGATVLFEFGFGHYVNGDSWEELLGAYDVRRGNLWLLDVAGIAVAPAAARAWRLRREAATGPPAR